MLDLGAISMPGVLQLQREAGNLATRVLIQRAPPSRLPVSKARSMRKPSGGALGPAEEIANFAVLFTLATTREALTTGRFDNRTFVFSAPRLARSAELLASVVATIANEQRGGQISQAIEVWSSLEPDVRTVLAQAGDADARAGYQRVQAALYGAEAEELARGGEAGSLADPSAALYGEQDRQAGQVFFALRQVIDDSKGILQWNSRQIYRIAGVGGVGATEAQVRLMNYGRTALSWAVLWEEAQTLEERVEAARRKGLLAGRTGHVEAAGKYVEFFSRATTAAADTTNAVVGLLKGSTAKLIDVLRQEAASGSKVFGDAAAEQIKLAKRLQAYEGLKWVGKLSGGVEIVSGLLNLVTAIRDDDLRAGVGAGHSIAQGAITFRGAMVGAGAATTTFLSASVTVLWISIEAVFDIAELSAWGRRQAKLADMSRVLVGAASLVPAGKRMAGVADAYAKIDTTDPARRLAIEQRLTEMAAAPFAEVLQGLLSIRTEVERRPDWDGVMGEDARRALSELAAYQYWPSEAVSPEVIGNVSALAKRIFLGLKRVSEWAVAKYGK